jgi:hypothetical protein
MNSYLSHSSVPDFAEHAIGGMSCHNKVKQLLYNFLTEIFKSGSH